jgi:opacity protein-like surface antigen
MKTIKITVIGTFILFSRIGIAQVNSDVSQSAPAPAPVQQADNEPPFKSGEMGVRFMPTFSSLNLKNADGTTVKGDVTMSYGYGAFMGVNSKHLGLQIEVIYNAISQKYKDHDLERKIDINYVNIPLLLTLNTDKSKPVNFGVAIGPQVGINVGSKVTTTEGEETSTLHAAVAVKQNDFGFAYGAGLQFALNPLRTWHLDLGFRGVYGLVDISDDSATKETNSYYILDKTNLQTYSGYLGLSFVF